MSEKAKGVQVDISGTPLPDVLNTMQQDIDGKAESSYVDTELAKKSDTVYVDSQLLLKADSAAVALALATKADASALVGLASETYVNNAVSTKADASALVGLASETYVDNAVSTKADSTAVANALAAKADTSSVVSALVDKADASALSALDSAAVKKADLKQTTGGSEVTPMSQKAVTQAIAAGVGGVGEAPEDGKQYARKDGTWDEVTGGVEVIDFADFMELVLSSENDDVSSNPAAVKPAGYYLTYYHDEFDTFPPFYVIVIEPEGSTTRVFVANYLVTVGGAGGAFQLGETRTTIDKTTMKVVENENSFLEVSKLTKYQVEDDQDETFGLVSGERLAQAIAKHGGGGVEEAPIDGKQYARKDADWVETGSTSVEITYEQYYALLALTEDTEDFSNIEFIFDIEGVGLSLYSPEVTVGGNPPISFSNIPFGGEEVLGTLVTLTVPNGGALGFEKQGEVSPFCLFRKYFSDGSIHAQAIWETPTNATKYLYKQTRDITSSILSGVAFEQKNAVKVEKNLAEACGVVAEFTATGSVPYLVTGGASVSTTLMSSSSGVPEVFSVYLPFQSHGSSSMTLTWTGCTLTKAFEFYTGDVL